MRQKHKPAELAALSAFARALRENGVLPLYAPEITDRPDAAFLIDGSFVAIECRYVSHPELVKLLAPNDWPKNMVYEVILPREPHLWVKSAIEAKNSKINQYKARCGASGAWLLLHSSAHHRILHPDSSAGSEYFELLKLGAHLIQHNFDQVWLAELNDDAPAICIYKAGDAKPSVSIEDFVARNPPYPMNNFWLSKAEIISKTDEGIATINFNLNNHMTKPICIQPLDTRYQIDYEQVLSDPNRNNNRANLNVTIREEKPNF